MFDCNPVEIEVHWIFLSRLRVSQTRGHLSDLSPRIPMDPDYSFVGREGVVELPFDSGDMSILPSPSGLSTNRGM